MTTQISHTTALDISTNASFQKAMSDAESPVTFRAATLEEDDVLSRILCNAFLPLWYAHATPSAIGNDFIAPDVADMSKESQLVPLRLGTPQTGRDRTCQWGGSADEQVADVSGQVLSKLDKADEVDRRICNGC